MLNLPKLFEYELLDDIRVKVKIDKKTYIRRVWTSISDQKIIRVNKIEFELGRRLV